MLRRCSLSLWELLSLLTRPQQLVIKPERETPALDASKWPLLLKNYDRLNVRHRRTRVVAARMRGSRRHRVFPSSSVRAPAGARVARVLGRGRIPCFSLVVEAGVTTCLRRLCAHTCVLPCDRCALGTTRPYRRATRR